MEILSLPDLGPEHEVSIAVLRANAFSDLDGTALLRKKIAQGIPYAPYGGLYAVQGDEVVSMIEVPRLRFTRPRGIELMGGLAYVCTLPRVARQGLAGALIQEFFRREESAGIRRVFLWTGRHLVAHSLYVRLGFVDVFETPVFSREVGEPSPMPSGYASRPAEQGDLAPLERLRAEAFARSVGFVERFPGFLRSWVGSGLVTLPEILVLERGGERAGYALLREAWPPGARQCFEMVVSSPEDRSPLLAAVEARSRHAWLSLLANPRAGWSALLASAGYRGSEDRWGVLMAKDLRRPKSVAELREELGCDRPDFVAQQLDTF